MTGHSLINQQVRQAPRSKRGGKVKEIGVELYGCSATSTDEHGDRSGSGRMSRAMHLETLVVELLNVSRLYGVCETCYQR